MRNRGRIAAGILPQQQPEDYYFYFHCAFRFRKNPMTRAHVKLLGTCYKTGRAECLRIHHWLMRERQRQRPHSVPLIWDPPPWHLPFLRSHHSGCETVHDLPHRHLTCIALAQYSSRGAVHAACKGAPHGGGTSPCHVWQATLATDRGVVRHNNATLLYTWLSWQFTHMLRMNPLKWQRDREIESEA